MSTSSTMAKEFKLPMIPGTTCGEEMLRRNYRKTQIFGGKGDRVTKTPAVLLDQSAANDLLLRSQASYNETAASDDSPSKAAATLNGKVLRFFGYTKDQVQESNVEKERVRKVVICYFLEDGTLSVSEPKQDNSGFAFQGTLIKRHCIPRPDGRQITLEQLSVGADIEIYGRVYRTVDADPFTREFYARAGAPLADAEAYPRDVYTDLRNRPQKVHDVPSIASTTTLNITLSAEQIRGTQQFLAYDRNVLRCDCTWNDTKSLYGETHYLTLYYFLSDDCIAVCEKDGVNTGRDPFPNFVRRMKIPRPSNSTGKFENLSSSLTFKAKDASSQSFYTDADIRIGNVLNVFGRDVLICDYDKNTREFLQQKFGITEYNPIDTTVPQKPKPARELPPYNGFGDEEDSLGSCLRLDVKPPRKDGTRFAKYSNNGVKFVMRLDNNVPTDEIRRFVLTCFLADDTICIFEPVQRNSGIVGGKFLQRQKVRKPDGKPFVAADFHVGCRTVINGFPFVCIATDERSLSFMEQNGFEHSDTKNIIRKLQAMLASSNTGLAEAFRQADRDAKGTLDFQEMHAMFQRLNLPLSDQELLTILRHFDRNGDSSISYEEFISRILPEGSSVGIDRRNWKELYDGQMQWETTQLRSVQEDSKKSAQATAAAAAAAAAQFLELYHARRALFNSEFRFVADYAADALIGEREFLMCSKDRLKLSIDDAKLEALAAALFPEGARRITYEELNRLFNGTSNQSHNVEQIKLRK